MDSARKGALMQADDATPASWKDRIVAPEEVLKKIHPGMHIFLSSGPAEPRTLLRALRDSKLYNLQDLGLMQLISVGDVVGEDSLQSRRYRLKTFFSGGVANHAITEGQIDLVPSYFSDVPRLLSTGAIRVDVAFVQITEPDSGGFVSLGLAVDTAREAIEKAGLVVGEINPALPRTLGDSFVALDAFDALVESQLPPHCAGRWPLDPTFEQLAENVASQIDDGSCLAYAIGPLFEALVSPLSKKRDLGIHSLLVTDAVMDLMLSGAVTNRRKASFRGRTLGSWVVGTPELHAWVHENPRVEMQGVDVTACPMRRARNERFVSILHARKVDLTGRVALHFGAGTRAPGKVLAAAGPAEVADLLLAARLSLRGKSIVAIPSRNLQGKSNILAGLGDLPHQLIVRESIDLVVTEFGVAHLAGRTVRERAQALIDVAHPDDRASLVEQGKASHLLFPDQIYLAEAGHFYPKEVATTRTFKGGLEVDFRAIRPSDEEEMRQLFYRFSEEAVYYRYFSPIKTMPHRKMQSYVNVDYRTTMCIVATVSEPHEDHVIAEARYVCLSPEARFGDIAFVVDEAFQGRGIASFLFLYLMQIARERGLEGFTADVISSNKAMLRVLEKSPHPIRARVEMGSYHLEIPFGEQVGPGGKAISFS